MEKEQETIKINVNTSNIDVAIKKIELAIIQANTLKMLLEEQNMLCKEIALSKINTKKVSVFQVATLLISVAALAVSLFIK